MNCPHHSTKEKQSFPLYFLREKLTHCCMWCMEELKKKKLLAKAREKDFNELDYLDHPIHHE